MITGGKSTAVVAHGAVHEAGHAAMVGSTAAVPGAIVGGLGGAALATACLGVLWFFMLFTTLPWYDQVVKNWLVTWYLSFIAAGATIGLLAGMFLGSALGAIFGGIRSMSRH